MVFNAPHNRLRKNIYLHVHLEAIAHNFLCSEIIKSKRKKRKVDHERQSLRESGEKILKAERKYKKEGLSGPYDFKEHPFYRGEAHRFSNALIWQHQQLPDNQRITGLKSLKDLGEILRNAELSPQEFDKNAEKLIALYEKWSSEAAYIYNHGGRGAILPEYDAHLLSPILITSSRIQDFISPNLDN